MNTADEITHSSEVSVEFSFLVLQRVGKHLVGRWRRCSVIWNVATPSDNTMVKVTSMCWSAWTKHRSKHIQNTIKNATKYFLACQFSPTRGKKIQWNSKSTSLVCIASPRLHCIQDMFFLSDYHMFCFAVNVNERKQINSFAEFENWLDDLIVSKQYISSILLLSVCYLKNGWRKVGAEFSPIYLIYKLYKSVFLTASFGCNCFLTSLIQVNL